MIKHNEPMASYLADPALGSSRAKLALKSLRLFKDAEDGIYAPKDKGHFQVGTLIHMRALEPERFAKCVTATGPINEKTGFPYGRDTKAFAAWQAENPDVMVVEEWTTILLDRMPPEVKALLTDGEAEVSVYAENFLQVLAAKCRPDYLKDTTIIDIKTCNDVDDAERIIYRLKYWFSHAWYRMVMKHVTGKTHHFRFVFAEKNPPYRWRIVDLDADYSMWAEDQVSKTVENLGFAASQNNWDDDGDLYMMASRPEYSDAGDDDEEGE